MGLLRLLGIEKYLKKVKTYIDGQSSAKQDKLVSGTNIKTINGTSILGSGNIAIEGGSGGGSGTSAPSDWNAVEGEAGHIENKICRFLQNGREYKFTDALKRADFTPIPNEYGDVTLYKKEVSYTGLQLVVTNRGVTEYGDTYSSALRTASLRNGKYIVPFYGNEETSAQY